MGLQGMINDMLARCDFDPRRPNDGAEDAWRRPSPRSSSAVLDERSDDLLRKGARPIRAPVLGITGTGGAGKSSLTDELVRRFRLDQGDAAEDRDPLGRSDAPQDRRRAARRPHPHERDPRPERLHALARHARRRAARSRPRCGDAIAACRAAGFDLVIVETSGIGQGDAAIVPLVDALALRDDAGVRRREPAREDRHARLRRLRRDQQVRPPRRRGRAARRAQAGAAQPRGVRRRPEEMPVFGTIASRFNDDGVTALYHAVAAKLAEKGLKLGQARCRRPASKVSSSDPRRSCRRQRARYLAEIAEAVRGYHAHARAAGRASRASASSSRRRGRCWARQLPELDALLASRSSSTPTRGSCSRSGRRRCKAYSGRRARGEGPRQGAAHRAHARLRSPARSVPKVALPKYRGPRRAAALAPAREPARRVPVHRRRVPLQARERGPDAHVRRRGRSVPHQPALPPAVAATCRRSACPPRSTR